MMLDKVHELYESRNYPPMSHPLADPAVSAVAARMGGLLAPVPRQARILEIGCSTGHHLIPLALRWPESRCTGIDLSERAIKDARSRATAAGCGNIIFSAVDLRGYQPEGGPFDYIIAHGFFSWVPDDVKAVLLEFCRSNLSPSGVAIISFNVESGWRARFPVIQKVRAIQQAGGGDVVAALKILKETVRCSESELTVIDDMLAKGSAILPFDDFAPVNDPWALDRFTRAAARAGLRWLGESDPGENVPVNLSVARVQEIKRSASDPLGFQMAMDEAAGRTFRSGLLCRDDAPVSELSPEILAEFCLRSGSVPVDPKALQIDQVIRSFAPGCLPLAALRDALPGQPPGKLAPQIFNGITRGWIRPRIEAMRYDAEPPGFPKLDRFRLLCAREELPLVDAWHSPCTFPSGQFPILAAMDGSRSLDELKKLAGHLAPELDFERWLRHLAWRGMFA